MAWSYCSLFKAVSNGLGMVGSYPPGHITAFTKWYWPFWILFHNNIIFYYLFWVCRNGLITILRNQWLGRGCAMRYRRIGYKNGPLKRLWHYLKVVKWFGMSPPFYNLIPTFSKCFNLLVICITFSERYQKVVLWFGYVTTFLQPYYNVFKKFYFVGYMYNLFRTLPEGCILVMVMPKRYNNVITTFL
jgi:hypothetical protein